MEDLRISHLIPMLSFFSFLLPHFCLELLPILLFFSFMVSIQLGFLAFPQIYLVSTWTLSILLRCPRAGNCDRATITVWIPVLFETLIQKKSKPLKDVTQGFPGSSDSKESACNGGGLGLIPRLWRSPLRRAWQPTPVFLPGEFPWTEDPGRLQSMGLKRVGHNWATKHSTTQGVIQSTFCWLQGKRTGLWHRSDKDQRFMVFFLWPTQSKSAYYPPVRLFPNPAIFFLVYGAFLRTPIRVASSNKGCLQVVFSSLQLKNQLQQWWSMEFRNLPLNLFLTHAHVAAVCRTGLLLWVTLTLKHIHACLSASCGQLSWWKFLAIWFLANMFCQPLLITILCQYPFSILGPSRAKTTSSA